MVFVPVIPVTSPQAPELAQRLADVVQQYRQSHPELRERDVLRAFEFARVAQCRGAAPRARGPLAAVAAAAAVLGVAFSEYSKKHPGTDTAWVLVVAVAAIVAAAAVLLIRALNR